VRSVLEYVLTFTPTVVNCTHGVAEVLTSSLNPDSLEELSTQARLIWVLETVVAVRLEGALGTEDVPARVVADAVFE
jgi:hypothetical protein